MKARDCCSQTCNQGRSCPQRIPTVRPASAKVVDAIERCGWWIGLGILCLAVLLNVGG